MADWNSIIEAMRARSGEPTQHEMSDETAAFLDDRFGVQIEGDDRLFISHLPEVDFEGGLSDTEIEAVESRFGFHFPPDLRSFLQAALPVGDRFPNWRRGDEVSLREWLDVPLAGVCFDVEHNNFWFEDWGPRPESLEQALRTCRTMVTGAPRLIPICGHRFIPDEPRTAGNPVFSVHQTDIIHYGYDLEDYLRNEFTLGGRQPWPDEVRRIRFWEIERWQDVRWSEDDGAVYWNR